MQLNHFLWRGRLAHCSLVAAMALSTPVAARYVVTSLAPSPGSATSAVGDTVFGINNAGQSIGQSIGGTNRMRAVEWDRHGNPTELATPAAAWSSKADSLNAAGVIVGDIGLTAEQDSKRATRWESPGSYDFFLPDNGHASFADAVSGQGWIGGIRYTVVWDDVTFDTFVWSPDGTTRWVNPSVSGDRLEFFGANSSNVFSGFQFQATDSSVSAAAIWDPVNGVTTLPGIGGYYAAAEGINDAGMVVGTEYDGDITDQPMWWDAAHNLHLLNVLGGSTGGVATGINDVGQIVGWSHDFLTCNGFVDIECRSATIWSLDGKATDLNSLIDPALGIGLLSASVINDKGEVQGMAIDASGKHFAYLLSTVPEPASWTMMIFGFGLIGGVLRSGHSRRPRYMQHVRAFDQYAGE